MKVLYDFPCDTCGTRMEDGFLYHNGRYYCDAKCKSEGGFTMQTFRQGNLSELDYKLGNKTRSLTQEDLAKAA